MIVLSMLTFRPGQMGGAETYARGLTAALARHGRLGYRCLLPHGGADAAGGLPAVIAKRVDTTSSGLHRVAQLVAATPRTQPMRDARAVHYPFTVPVPRPTLPYALTIQDLLHLEQPELFSAAARIYRTFGYDLPARKASRLIVASGYVRDSIVERLGVPAERIRVAPYGLDHDDLRPGTEPRDPYLLYPARAWPHKNHAALFEAFRALRRERPELQLVLTGDDTWRDLPDGVVSLGRIPRPELIEHYRRAAALVFPSLNEGFGFPPLEAMACGCLVAVSRSTALPETCGEAAAYFDPRDPGDIASTVDALLAEPADRRERGIERAGAFTWERAAAAHDAVYAELEALNAA